MQHLTLPAHEEAIDHMVRQFCGHRLRLPLRHVVQGRAERLRWWHFQRTICPSAYGHRPKDVPKIMLPTAAVCKERQNASERWMCGYCRQDSVLLLV